MCVKIFLFILDTVKHAGNGDGPNKMLHKTTSSFLIRVSTVADLEQLESCMPTLT